MKKKLFLAFVVLGLVAAACENRESRPVVRPEGDFQSSPPDRSDRDSNGGSLRFTLEERLMHDEFFVAQFTPRGALFRKDNLQLYNYNPGSGKYPQFLISIDYEQSDLKRWVGMDFPLDFLAFTPAPNTLPYQSEGRIKITKVSDSKCEGRFSGSLRHPVTKKKYAIRGDFKAVLKLNI